MKNILFHLPTVELDSESLVDPVSFLADTVPPLSLAFKHRDEDNPSFSDALSSHLIQQMFADAMSTKVKELEGQSTWSVVSHPLNTKVLPSMWTFKIKCFPDGWFQKAKAQFCIHGDQQVAGIDYFDTYTPVVSWVTIHLLLILWI